MANFNSNPRGGLTVDRDSLHASDGYKRQIAAMELMKESEMAEKISLQQVRDTLASWLGGSEACLDARNVALLAPMVSACDAHLAGMGEPVARVKSGYGLEWTAPSYGMSVKAGDLLYAAPPAQVVDVGAIREVAYAIQQHRGDKAFYRALADKLTRAIGNAQAESN